MDINREEALVILEALGSVARYQGATTGEESLDEKIREHFADNKEVSEYDYQEQADKYGW